MAKWDNTVFIRSNDIKRLALAMQKVLSLDDYSLCAERPFISDGDQYEMRYGTSHTSRIWAAALIPTDSDWTIIKTSPFELLCQSPRGFFQPRLQLLSEMMRGPAIQVNVYHGASIFTLETSEMGACFLGGTMSETDLFYELAGDLEDIDGDPKFEELGLSYDARKAFVLTPKLNALFENIADPKFVDSETFGETLTGKPFEEWNNHVQIACLIGGQTLSAPGSQAFYFARQEAPDVDA